MSTPTQLAEELRDIKMQSHKGEMHGWKYVDALAQQDWLRVATHVLSREKEQTIKLAHIEGVVRGVLMQHEKDLNPNAVNALKECLK